MAHIYTNEGPLFLSTLTADRGERRLALGVVLVSVFLFILAVPFAKVQLTPVQAFIPIYESVLVINDLITAVLLFGQFHILRSRALLVLACGYLFTAFLTVAHALTFPGLFAPTGLLGAGPQSTAWLYMFWHGGFPLFVVAYALLNEEAPAGPQRGSRRIILSAGLAVLVLAGALTFGATAGQDLFPAIMQGNRYTPVMRVVVSSVWALTLLGLAVLWRREKHTVLDQWLMVTLCAWLFDIALAAVLNGGRFDLGFYAGRIYGLLASIFVLQVLLLENGKLYARLVKAHESERHKSADLQRLSDELTQLNARLEQNNRQLEDASRLKSEFLASMSHELRTPLNAIIGFSELLKDGVAGDLTLQQKDFITQVFDSARHLLELINDILDLSKVEAGKMTLELDHVELNDLMQKCVAIFREQAHKRDVRLQLITPKEEAWVVADIRKLRQIVYNLMSNALKFVSEGGEVQLRLREISRTELRPEVPAGMHKRMLPLPDGAEERFLEICVSDNGIGIDGEDLPALFQTFRQLDSSLARQHGGTGLGLALVSRFAALHGGTVGIGSAPGKGAQFFVWLPWRTSKAAA
jgi:signal transduction histidine kinase